ncbi:MAG: aspartate/glutamate racemase family protein [Kiritimatiellae bacterium]|nr:aspartate/glutamate racemase family protein [Kiritimatiellia bacterium]
MIVQEHIRNLRRLAVACAAVAFAASPCLHADEAPIGVFDSGLGGFTVLESLLDTDLYDNVTGRPEADGRPDLACERFVYLGDQANMPYGDYAAAGKSDLLRRLIVDDAEFLLATNCHRSVADRAPTAAKPRAKIIVIACNTATAWGLADVRRRAAGEGVKVVGVIEAGVRATLDMLEAGPASRPFAIGVLATPGTIASGAYARTIRQELKARGVTAEVPVVDQGCAGLADAVEAGSPAADAIARSNLCALVEHHRVSGSSVPLRAVILGCTHYPFVLATLNRTVAELRSRGESLPPDFRFVDPARYTAAECFRLLRESGRLSTSSVPGGSMAFLSVANPDLPSSCLTPDGALTREFKYGRAADFREVVTRPVPFTRAAFGDAVFANIARLLPRTAALLDSQEVVR